ncbi:MAG: MFS transporter [Zoogloea sp.]|nr:MFS transporter [Zoogloea sp.]
MSPAERRIGVSLAAIFGLRMLGLFVILPVFSLYARHLPGGDSLTWVGLAFGAYGLVQAFLQIPFGMASDRYGRKKVIILGLLLFAAGSVVAALAQDIYWVTAGRAIQGAGAISAAVTALAADLTRDQHRTKVMAMIGSTIGLVFAGSLVIAPLLYGAIGMNGMFWMVAVLALSAIALLKLVVPDPPKVEAKPTRFAEVLRDPQLLRLNFGIFSLHLIQTAMFMVVPRLLVDHGGLVAGEHWKVYLPVVLVSFVAMVPAVIVAEKKQLMKPVFVGAVALLVVAQSVFLEGYDAFWPVVAGLLVFFIAFNVLEATLPSMISRIAPPQAKGSALGVYNTTQSVGLFLGSSLGGWLAQHHGDAAVFLACGVFALLWLGVAAGMRPPPKVAYRELPLPAGADLDALKALIVEFPGVREAVIEPERRIAYLKVNMDGWDETRLRQLLGGKV